MQNFHELIQGFHNFKEDYFLREREFFSSLVHGQSPKTLVVACCDSRVDPAILMGCRPGDLFVARSIAAIVPDVEKAGEHDAVVSAVEYAVKHLDVRNIIVMGHSNCGGIHGLLHPEVVSKEPYISRWLCLAHPVLEELEHEDPDEPADVRARRCEEGTVLQSIDSLLSYDSSMQARSHSTPSTTTLPAVPCTSGMPKRRTSRQPSSPSSEQATQTFPRPALAPRILSD